MNVSQDVMQRIYDSRTHLVIVNLWSTFQAILGVSLTTDHSIVSFLESAGVVWPFFAAATLLSLALAAFFLFTWLRSKVIFIALIMFPLVIYALINLILVARGQAEADRIPLSIEIIGGLFFSWWMGERDEALYRLNAKLSADNSLLVEENHRLAKAQDTGTDVPIH